MISHPFEFTAQGIADAMAFVASAAETTRPFRPEEIPSQAGMEIVVSADRRVVVLRAYRVLTDDFVGRVSLMPKEKR